MKEIIRIVIKGGSGYCPITEAFQDKVTIDENSICYIYKPLYKSETNPPRNWKYRTTSPIYKQLYKNLVEIIPEIMKRDVEEYCTDIGGIEFIVTYADQSVWKNTYWVPGERFKDIWFIIKLMIPECEKVSLVLRIGEDYEENER